MATGINVREIEKKLKFRGIIVQVLLPVFHVDGFDFFLWIFVEKTILSWIDEK